ncbi:Class I SAM-dependent methyltransferase, partial [Dysosmobacter welbionis]
YLLYFFFELRAFIIEPLLLFKKSLLFRLQCLQARQFFIALHGKKRTPRRLKDHKLCLMLCLEPRLVFCLLEGIIYRLEPLVVGDIFDERLDFPQTCFNAFQFLAGTVIGTVNILNLLLKIGVLKQIVFREIVECPCRFLEDSELCFMLVTLAVDKPDPLLNISDERDALRRGLSLASSGRPSGNPLLDAFLGVVLSDSFRPGKPLLTFSTEGDVFASLDFISGFLHEPQKIIVVLRRDDEPVDGLLEFLLPARAAF